LQLTANYSAGVKYPVAFYRAPIITIWTDGFFWYFWQPFSRFLTCPGACWLVFITGLYPYPHRRHTAVAATLPARLRMYWSTQTVHTNVLRATGLLLLLAYLTSATGWKGGGRGDIYILHWLPEEGVASC